MNSEEGQQEQEAELADVESHGGECAYQSDADGSESETDFWTDPEKTCVNVFDSGNDYVTDYERNRSNNRWRDCDVDNHGDVGDCGSDCETDSENLG